MSTAENKTYKGRSLPTTCFMWKCGNIMNEEKDVGGVMMVNTSGAHTDWVLKFNSEPSLYCSSCKKDETE